ncbi:MAG: hypothetical protein Q9194_006890 [Teloschistes cf. exilis]
MHEWVLAAGADGASHVFCRPQPSILSAAFEINYFLRLYEAHAGVRCQASREKVLAVLVEEAQDRPSRHQVSYTPIENLPLNTRMSRIKKTYIIENSQPLMTNENTMTPMPGANEFRDIWDAQPLTPNENTMNPMPSESQDFCGEESCTTAESSAMPEPKKRKDVECAGPSTTKEDTTVPESRESEDVLKVKDINLSGVDRSEDIASPQLAATKAPITKAKAGERMTAPEVIGSEDTCCAPAQIRTDNNKVSKAFESEETCLAPAPTRSEDDRIAKVSVSEEASRAHALMTRPLNLRMSTAPDAAAEQEAEAASERTTRYCSWGMVKLMWKKHFGKVGKTDESIPIVLRATIPITRCNEPYHQRTLTALRSVYPETSFDELVLLAIGSLREQNSRRIQLLDGLRVPQVIIHDLTQKDYGKRSRILDHFNYRSGALGSYWRENRNKMLPLQIEMVLEE